MANGRRPQWQSIATALSLLVVPAFYVVSDRLRAQKTQPQVAHAPAIGQ